MLNTTSRTPLTTFVASVESTAFTLFEFNGDGSGDDEGDEGGDEGDDVVQGEGLVSVDGVDIRRGW